MIKFNGENILVTGASDGLGKAICLLLNSLGANVIGIARNESKLEQLKKEIEFNSDRLFTVLKDGKLYIGVSNVCLNLGMTKDMKRRQVKNIQSDILTVGGKKWLKLRNC